MSDELELDEKAAKNAKRLLMLAFLAAVVAIIVLVIDQSLKKQILTEAQKAHELLKQVQDLSEEVKRHGQPTAWEAGGVPGADLNSSNGVVRDAAA